MHLINVHTLRMEEFYEPRIPDYVILSHRWEDEEVTFQIFERGEAARYRGNHKIDRLCAIARQDKIDWVWLDTCCIDKRNSTELSEAINSMYKWYARSVYCAAYLFDVDDSGPSFGRSSWFRRCWTLQELISPRNVRFYAKDWQCIGTKSELCNEIVNATRIGRDVLLGEKHPHDCSIAQRMSWASGREATRIEDEAYSLLGLFDISLPMLYGEAEKAFLSLQERILQSSDDQSIFSWDIGLDRCSSVPSTQNKVHGLLARNPSAFGNCHNVIATNTTVSNKSHSYSFTYIGVELQLPTKPIGMNLYECALECSREGNTAECRDVIYLRQLEDEEQYARVEVNKTSVTNCIVSEFTIKDITRIRKMHVRHVIRHSVFQVLYRFLINSITLPNRELAEVAQTAIWSTTRGFHTWHLGPSLLMLTEPDFGTAGIVSFPGHSPFAHQSPHHFRWLRLAFDADFRPICILGQNNPISEFVANYKDDISWSRLEGFSMAKGHFVPAEQIDKELSTKRFCVFVGDKHQSNIIDLPRYKIKVSLDLQEIPRGSRIWKSLDIGSDTWKIWTVNIIATGDHDVPLKEPILSEKPPHISPPQSPGLKTTTRASGPVPILPLRQPAQAPISPLRKAVRSAISALCKAFRGVYLVLNGI